jgi:hypothetical protein
MSPLLSLLASRYNYTLTPASMKLNPRLRILRYDSDDGGDDGGDDFSPHFDATTEDLTEQGSVWRSYITVLVYLNDCATTGTYADPTATNKPDSKAYTGGRTLFLSQKPASSNTSSDTASDTSSSVSVQPSAGSVALFEHDQFHSGERVTSGTKWIMRTDVMFNIGESIEAVTELDSKWEGVQADAIGSSSSPSSSSSSKPVVATLASLLTNLSLSHLTDDLEAMGLTGSLESFVSPGEMMVKMMLNEVCEDEADTNAIWKEAVAAVQTTAAAAAAANAK